MLWLWIIYSVIWHMFCEKKRKILHKNKRTNKWIYRGNNYPDRIISAPANIVLVFRNTNIGNKLNKRHCITRYVVWKEIFIDSQKISRWHCSVSEWLLFITVWKFNLLCFYHEFPNNEKKPISHTSRTEQNGSLGNSMILNSALQCSYSEREQ